MEKLARKIIVRDGRKEDAADIARLILMAWPVESILEQNPGMTREALERGVARLVAMENTLYSYENTVVAVLDDCQPAPQKLIGAMSQPQKVVGAMVGYDGAQYDELREPVLATFAELAGGRRSESVRMAQPPCETGAGEFYLDSIGVDPAYRGCGIGTMLFDAMLSRAATRGHTVAGLLVDEENPAAARLYARLGFRAVDSIDFFGHDMQHQQCTL